MTFFIGEHAIINPKTWGNASTFFEKNTVSEQATVHTVYVAILRA
jgi:hypothetical protein